MITCNAALSACTSWPSAVALASEPKANGVTCAALFERSSVSFRPAEDMRRQAKDWEGRL